MLNPKYLFHKNFIPNKYWNFISPKLIINQKHVQKIKLLIEDENEKEEEKSIDTYDYANIEKIDQKKDLKKKNIIKSKIIFLENKEDDFSFIKSNFSHICYFNEIEKDDDFFDLEDLSETYSTEISDTANDDNLFIYQI